MIPRGSEPRGGVPISLIAIHTAEGATTARGLEHYLDQPRVEASYHVLVDDDTTIRYLSNDVACWAMLSGNHRSLQLCFTGFAAWDRSTWLAHDAMLRRGAAEVARWCVAHHIPQDKLTAGQVGDDRWGICGHWDWTMGKHDGTHTDPGPNFPWDVFIGYVRGAAAGGDADMTPEEHAALFDIRMQLAGSVELGKYPGWPAHPDDTDRAKTLVDYVRALHAEQQSQRAVLAQILARLSK